jgi:hypothetical protein
MNAVAGIGHNGGPQFQDAQQAAGFAVPALYRTHATVFEQKYPSFDYAGLVPVNTDGDMWDIGTLVYSGDIAGKADYLGGKAFDVPNASVSFTQGLTSFHLAGVGYELSLQEVNRASRMNVDIDGRKASAARMIAEKFIYDRVIRGDVRKNTTGLINNLSVPTANAPNGSWATATAQQMQADINAALNDVIVNSRETAMPNAVMIPTSRFLTANNTQLPNVGMSVLTYLKQNNSYTAMTGQPLDIRPSRELETAGASSTGRIVAYEKSPDNMEFFLPGLFEFMPLFPTSSMTWRVDGVMNVGQLEIYRPKTVSYRDGL